VDGSFDHILQIEDIFEGVEFLVTHQRGKQRLLPNLIANSSCRPYSVISQTHFIQVKQFFCKVCWSRQAKMISRDTKVTNPSQGQEIYKCPGL
jgi:hypothetical protein